jgi:hypothetical protein
VVFTEPLKLIDFRIGKDGDLAMDFSRFDKWVKVFVEEGVIGRIEGAPFASRGGWEDPFTVSIIVREENGDHTKCIDVAPTDPRADRFYGRFLPKYWGHLCEKGWDKIYLQHIGDEAITANTQSFLTAAGLIHTYAPDFQIVDTAHVHLGRKKPFEDWAEKVNICVADPEVLAGNAKRLDRVPGQEWSARLNQARSDERRDRRPRTPINASGTSTGRECNSLPRRRLAWPS